MEDAKLEITLDQWISLFTGVGTFFAALVALHLGRKSTKVHLKVYVGHRLIVSEGSDKTQEVIAIGVANVGLSTVFIQSIFWSTNLWRYGKSAYQKEKDMPRKLEHGESAIFTTEFKQQHNPLQALISNLEITRTSLPFLRVLIVTSIGIVKKTKPEKILLSKIKKLLEQNTQGPE